MLRQYPGPDELTDLMLSDMDRWIMDRINQVSAPPAGDLIEHRWAN